MNFSSITEELNNFLDNSVLTEKHMTFFQKKFTMEKLNAISSIIFNQTMPNENTCMIYSLSLKTFVFDMITIENTKYYEIHGIIKLLQDQIMLRMLHPDIMYNFIKNNEKNKLIFIPLCYDIELSDVLHQASIIIYPQSKTIYLVDPNESGSFFENYMEIKSTDIVETCLDNYFSQLKMYGLIGYRFIRSHEWNKNTISLNSNKLDIYGLGSGHCVILSVLIIHICNLFNITPTKTYEILHKLTKDELMFIISGYMIGIYNILN